MTRSVQKAEEILEEVPSQVNESEILYYLNTKEVNWKHINVMKGLMHVTDNVVSDWLNVSVRTFRDYRKPASTFKKNVKEHIVLLIALFKHGIKVFGSSEAFDLWLRRGNFYLDNQAPQSFLNTVTGIKFLDDRLTGMEYGDNA